MSGLTYCAGTFQDGNCVSVCMQQSDCSASPAATCCEPNKDGSFCIGADGNLAPASTCLTDMGPASQCYKFENKGMAVEWGSSQPGAFTATVAVSQTDPQYQNYERTFC